MHCVKARDGVRSEFRERLSYALYRLWRLAWVTLGEEFVGIADDPFFQGLRQQVPNWRDGQVLSDNLLGCDTGTRMPLTHPSMTIQPHRVKHLTTKDTMQDVRLVTEAADATELQMAQLQLLKMQGETGIMASQRTAAPSITAIRNAIVVKTPQATVLRIYDMQGRMRLTAHVDTGTQYVSTAQLSAGLYIAAMSVEGRNVTCKIQQ